MASFAQQLADLAGRLDHLRGEIPAAIAEGIRVSGARPAGEKGAPSLQFGIVEEVFDADGYADVTLDGQTAANAVNMLGGLVSGERVAVLLYPPSGNLAIGMATPAAVGGIPAGGTTGQVLTKIDAADFNADWEDPATGSSFPIGPYDDGVATYVISEIPGSPIGGAISAMYFQGASDLYPANEAQILVGFNDGAGTSGGGGGGIYALSTDGSLAQVTAAVVDAQSATVQFTSGATGAPNPAQITAYTTPTSSSATLYATYVELQAVSSDVKIVSPSVVFNGQLASPTISDSDFAFWLDDTPGATIFNIKAKDSGGTVRTVAIPLL